VEFFEDSELHVPNNSGADPRHAVGAEIAGAGAEQHE